MSMTTDQPEAAPRTEAIWPLGAMEPALRDLESTAGLLLHIATSEYDAESDELFLINNKLLDCHNQLKSLWQQAWDKREKEREAHKAELAAAKARTAPGSQADAERVAGLWRVLASAAKAVLEIATEAMPAGEPVASGLPPAESGRV